MGNVSDIFSRLLFLRHTEKPLCHPSQESRAVFSFIGVFAEFHQYPASLRRIATASLLSALPSPLKSAASL